MNIIKVFGIFILCFTLASCARVDDNFFRVSKDQLNKGYTWRNLNKCRHAKANVPAISLKWFDGGYWVCYVLTPPARELAEIKQSTSVDTDVLNSENIESSNSSDDISKNIQQNVETETKPSGVTWQFLNY